MHGSGCPSSGLIRLSPDLLSRVAELLEGAAKPCRVIGGSANPMLFRAAVALASGAQRTSRKSCARGGASACVELGAAVANTGLMTALAVEQRSGSLAPRLSPPGPGLCFGLGLALTLVLGAGLGAWNLCKADWAIGEVSGESVLIHAHSQIFGFVTLFIAGVVGHALPRIGGRPLRRPALVWVGVLGAITGQLLFPFGIGLSLALVTRLAEGCDLLAAVALAKLIFDETTPEGPPGAERGREIAALRPFLRVGALFHVAAAAVGLLGALDQRLIADRPALWQLALYGFVGSYVLGMSFHVLRRAGGFALEAGGERLLAALWAAGVLLVAIALLPTTPGVSLLRAGRLVELGVAAVASWRFGLFRPLARPRVGAPFFAAAYGWLLASLALSAAIAVGLLPEHQLLADAARHLLTIGWITQMILGVALRMLPTLRGIPLALPALASAAFVLINGSAALRLGRLLAATVDARGLWLSGASGWLALLSLLGFAASLFATVRSSAVASEPS